MSELKSYKLFHRTSALTSPEFISIVEFGNGDEVYFKSEADKVIAELKADYKEACDRLQTANLIKDEQLAAARHHKYKRCLAMAWWCSAELGMLVSTWESKIKYYKRWQKRWLELAEQFKEAK